MTETGQAEFIGNIKKALNRKDSSKLALEDIIQSVPDSADLKLLENIRSRSKEMHLSLFNQLAETGTLLNMVVTTENDLNSAAASILQIAVEKKSEWGDKKSVVAWDHPLVQSLNLSARLQLMVSLFTIRTSNQEKDGKKNLVIRLQIHSLVLHRRTTVLQPPLP